MKVLHPTLPLLTTSIGFTAWLLVAANVGEARLTLHTSTSVTSGSSLHSTTQARKRSGMAKAELSQGKQGHDRWTAKAARGSSPQASSSTARRLKGENCNGDGGGADDDDDDIGVSNSTTVRNSVERYSKKNRLVCSRHRSQKNKKDSLYSTPSQNHFCPSFLLAVRMPQLSSQQLPSTQFGRVGRSLPILIV